MSSINETIKLKHKITGYVATSLVAVSIIISAVSLIPLYRVSRDRVNREISYLVSNRKMAVEEFLSKTENIASQVTSRTRIRQKLELYNRGALSRNQLISFTAPKLRDALVHSPSINGICRLDKKGRVAVEVGQKIPAEMKNISLPLKEIQVKTYGGKSEAYVLIAAAPIYNRKKIPVGTDLVLFNLNGLKHIIDDSSNMGKTAHLALISNTPEGFINVFSGKGKKSHLKCLARKSLMEKSSRSKEPVVSSLENNGINQIIACTMMKQIPWYLMLSINKSELYLPVWRNILQTAGFVLLFTLLGTGGIIFILRPLTGRLLIQVEDMEKEIKVLSGMIPICSSCKKIRSDEGYWNIIEEYIEANSEAEFSHGLCPSCAENLYGNEKWYKKKKQS